MESSVFSRIFLVSLFIISVLIVNFIFSPIERVIYLAKLKPEVKTLDIDGMSFRDLNKNNKLDRYEDYRLDTAQRVEDLISQMTLEEKVGTLFHPPVTINPDWMFRLYSLFVDGGKLTESEIINQHINHFNLYGNPKPERLAKRLNNLQKIASRSRLGIPVTISSDPIHEVPNGGGVASFSLDGFSKWPSQLGLAASQNPSLVKQFAEIAREEYLAVGIRTALHPMADLATEPRWARNFGTFGSNAKLASDFTIAYMDGFQGKKIDNKSVLTMVKHFPGGGPQEDGLDPHLYSGQNQVYPGNNFEYCFKHLSCSGTKSAYIFSTSDICGSLPCTMFQRFLISAFSVSAFICKSFRKPMGSLASSMEITTFCFLKTSTNTIVGAITYASAVVPLQSNTKPFISPLYLFSDKYFKTI